MFSGSRLGGTTRSTPGLTTASISRRRSLVCRAGDKSDRSRKGKQFEGDKRRRGRPAWKRSPYDTPLRDGNRDRLIGLLTDRATRTLMVYLMELNPIHYSWLVEYYKANPIPLQGTWDDVSGETFLRTLLSMPVETAQYKTGRDELYSNLRVMGVDPRNMAMRIMEIRSQLAKEFISDLQEVAEENSALMRETLSSALMGSISFGGDGGAAAAGEPGSASESEDGSAPTSGSSTPPVHPEVVEAEIEARARAEAEASAAADAERLRQRQRQLDEEARQRGLEEAARREAELRAARREAEAAAAAAAAAETAGSQGDEGGPEGSSDAEGAFGELGTDAAAVVAALNAAFARELPADALGADHPELGGEGEGGAGGSGGGKESGDGGAGRSA